MAWRQPRRPVLSSGVGLLVLSGLLFVIGSVVFGRAGLSAMSEFGLVGAVAAVAAIVAICR